MLGRGWYEPFDDFCLFLEDAGLRVSGLPRWRPAQPVEVVGDAARGVFWLRRISHRKLRERQQQDSLQQRQVPFDVLRRRYVCVNIEGANLAKLHAYRRRLNHNG